MRLRGDFVRRDGRRATVHYTAVRLWPAVFVRHDPMLKRYVRVSARRDQVTGKRNDTVVIYWRWPWDR